ncbi:hypothetical protein NDU88_008976 [Pleurodeles waltl]|uniref:Uncharacterized protein n=1 Tax=Pleurodeles waltl TaxID=8319 RepID=A0AAV7PY80_PLEWA|nr:hypothetical protein NDU88_008976 [Pleurodeles waltl]
MEPLPGTSTAADMAEEEVIIVSRTDPQAMIYNTLSATLSQPEMERLKSLPDDGEDSEPSPVLGVDVCKEHNCKTCSSV